MLKFCLFLISILLLSEPVFGAIITPDNATSTDPDLNCDLGGSLAQTHDGQASTATLTNGCREDLRPGAPNPASLPIKITYTLPESGKPHYLNQFRLFNDAHNPISDGIRAFDIVLHSAVCDNIIIASFVAANESNFSNSGGPQIFDLGATYGPIDSFDLIIKTTYTRAPVQWKEVQVNEPSVINNPTPCQADIILTKTDLKTSYSPGESGSYIIIIRNNGSSKVKGINVTDTLPSGMSLNTQWGCTADPNSSCITGTSGGTGATGSSNINQLVDIAGNEEITFNIPYIIVEDPDNY